jgi:hypothetical protein
VTWLLMSDASRATLVKPKKSEPDVWPITRLADDPDLVVYNTLPASFPHITMFTLLSDCLLMKLMY